MRVVELALPLFPKGRVLGCAHFKVIPNRSIGNAENFGDAVLFAPGQYFALLHAYLLNLHGRCPLDENMITSSFGCLPVLIGSKPY